MEIYGNRNDILTQQDIEDKGWDTSGYEINYEPGEHTAVLVGKVWAQNRRLRLFFDFTDGRRILALGQPFNKYLGFLEYPVGGTYRITFTRRSSGVYAEKAILLSPPVPGTVVSPPIMSMPENDFVQADTYDGELPFDLGPIQHNTASV